jgi:putative intracellular protease/amidase
MNIALFYYDGFAEFEIVFVGLLFKDQNLFSVAVENREYRSEEGQRYCVDKVIRDVDVDSIDLLVIPGGNPAPLFENLELKNFLDKLVSRNKKIAAICGGPGLLAAFGLLKGKKCTGNTTGIRSTDKNYSLYSESILSDEYVVVDGNIITGQGQAYGEFAVEIVNQMGLYKDKQEYDADLQWIKNVR